MTTEPIKVFISYSHDSDEHKQWVLKLATDLRAQGLDAILDQWDLVLGGNLPRFMEQGLSSAAKVLVICTNNYNEKSNAGKGGAGYEGQILTAEIYRRQDSVKYIPVVFGATTDPKTPTCLDGRMYTDFTNQDDYDNNLKTLIHELYGVKLQPKPALGPSPFATPPEPQPTLYESSSSFFSERFGKAFPGVRGIEWFDEPKIAADRLCLLLKDPLVFTNTSPIWWWRTGDLQITSLIRESDDLIVMNGDELLIKRIAAVDPGAYWQQFVYVETNPMPSTGVYPNRDIESQVKRKGYASEEFGVFQGRYITREEYDDGATVVDGQVVALEGNAEIRARFLTPYNFIIAPIGSGINNMDFDSVREDLLNGMLAGAVTIEDLAGRVRSLPKNNEAI
ncbi:toll/interleukin-1 receptor domain-containing protein [Pseudomonas sp. LF135]|uniref:toll/interleukin-1 receptor domain-containing protein n=1 Tax=Pseudomonas sp. Xaverov 83 TaxID=2666087 RepID=UPI001C5B36C0|nr:toll/interleukin-1 receptor domain-containing protein [Pseudomonas sp. Xaverov 83]